MSAFPRRHLTAIRELAAQVIEKRGANGAAPGLARDLLVGFYEVCMRTGQDGVIEAIAPNAADAAELAEDERFKGRLIAILGDRARFDPGGPRNGMAAQLGDCLLAAVGVEIRDEPARPVTLSDERRKEIGAAIAEAAGELVPERLRPGIIDAARARCEERHRKAFDKMAAQLDPTGTRLPPQPKVAIDAVKATQAALYEARTAIVTRVANAALDRAKPVLEREAPDAAVRLEQPITHRLTPRDLAVRRANEVQALTPDAVTRSLMASLAELLELAWSAAAEVARPYAVSQTFAVGDVIDHPTFGRGRVKAVATKNVDVEFGDATRTLLHARGK